MVGFQMTNKDSLVTTIVGSVEIWMHRPLTDDTMSDKRVQEFVIGVTLDSGDTMMLAFDLLSVRGMMVDLIMQIGLNVHSAAHDRPMT